MPAGLCTWGLGPAPSCQADRLSSATKVKVDLGPVQVEMEAQTEELQASAAGLLLWCQG